MRISNCHSKTAAKKVAMQILIILALILHVLSAVFWMGSSGTLGRSGGQMAEVLFPWQVAGIVIVVLTGGFLWSQLHAGGFGTYEQILAAGAGLALLAAITQGILIGPNLRKLRNSDAQARKIAAIAHRVASGLLGVCLICMVIARFV